MLNLKLNLNLENLLYSEGDYAVPYVDAVNSEVIIINGEDSITEDLIPIPSRDEIMPYNEAMGRYISENLLDIPVGMSAGRFLKQNQQMLDFYLFWDELASAKLRDWFAMNQFMI